MGFATGSSFLPATVAIRTSQFCFRKYSASRFTSPMVLVLVRAFCWSVPLIPSRGPWKASMSRRMVTFFPSM